jgi:S1-C subfamily serine protease
VVASLAVAVVAGVTLLVAFGTGDEDPEGGGGAAPAPELTAQQLTDRVNRGTVLVKAHVGSYSIPGTGVLVDARRHLVLTNSHVVSGSSSLEVAHAGTVTSASLHANAPCEDLALLRLTDEPPGLRELPIRSTDALRSGERVMAAGFDKGAARAKPRSRFGGVATANAASEADEALPRYPSVIKHTAVIKNGDSGGPLVDLHGRLIGINTFAVRATDSNADARDSYYAVSGSRIKEVLPALVRGRSRRDVGWKLGQGTRDEFAEEPVALDIDPFDAGVIVLGITAGSAADKAGLSLQDVVVEVRGEPVESVADVCRILDGAPSGSSLELTAASAKRPKGWNPVLRVP